jgi:hypothetical protein
LSSVIQAVGGCQCAPCHPCACTGYTFTEKGGTLTDVNGTYPLVWNTTDGNWQCCYLITLGNTYDWTTATTGTHPVAITYKVGCGSILANSAFVIRQWISVSGLHYAYTQCAPPQIHGYTGAPGATTNAVKDLGAVRTSCDPLIWSGAVSDTSGALIADPVGGSVSITLPVCRFPPLSPCTPCAIPQGVLFISWVNSTFGNASSPLAYTSGPDAWNSGCIVYSFGARGGSIKISMSCSGGVTAFSITCYQISNTCTASSQTYTLAAGDVSITTSNCSPYDLVFAVNPASTLATTYGFSSFTVVQ